MNGATTLLCAKVRRRPKRTITTRIGASQYFFSCLRNSNRSRSTSDFAIKRTHASEQMLVMACVCPPLRVQRPSCVRPRRLQWVSTERPHHDADRREDEYEEDREHDSRVRPAEDLSHTPPQAVRDSQRDRRDERQNHQ